MPANRKIWWGIRSDTGLLGIGWLTEPHTLRWNEGVAHWPLMFITRVRARKEARDLTIKHRAYGWKFHVTRLEVTYNAS